MRHLFMNASLNTVQLGLSSVALMQDLLQQQACLMAECHAIAELTYGGAGA